MGFQHFTQMYHDAVEVDRRAYLTAAKMQQCRSPYFPAEPGFMAEQPFEQVMVLARRLLSLWDAYVVQLQELHAAGRLRIWLRYPYTGQPMLVENVKVLEDSQDDLAPRTLYQSLQMRTAQ